METLKTGKLEELLGADAEALIGTRLYQPTESGFEAELKARLAALAARKR